MGAAAIVLLIAFGSLLAMGLPIATALMGIGSGLSGTSPRPRSPPSSWIGLGVEWKIYALFIVTRFRSELHEGAEPGDAMVTTMRTAAVLTAGSTMVIGMLGLLVLGQSLLNGVARSPPRHHGHDGHRLASAAAPALLSFTRTRLARPSRLNTFLGGKVFGRARPGARRAGGRSAVRPQSRPPSGGRAWSSGAPVRGPGGGGRHPDLAAPALAMKLSWTNRRQAGRVGYASYAAMRRGFGPGFDAPLIVVAKGHAGSCRVTRCAARSSGRRGSRR